ncbi:unnamed protein product [Medioppia subpectinata]|uniref:Protein kinase domain-containing protein n=1 Tax=Medioppia subpectinata TaxID=1979941 RepID=A0A7R9KC19_9ACAR|nr:unnamed protein product [Medioppia subpectinata]CAG2100538.1 unnamed protein product [Medioppia subpectinata]
MSINYSNNISGYLKTNIEEAKSIREVENLQKLDSVFVVKYHDSWIEGKHLYIQMEYCPQTLRDILKDKLQVFVRQTTEPMIIYEYFILCEIFRELLQCIEYIHGLDPPIIHRDIKPENILILYNEINKTFIKLGDFGLAIAHERQSQSHTRGAGTPKYMAPEVFDNRKYDIKADIYSLGGIGHEMFEINPVGKEKYISTIFSAKFNRLEDILRSMTEYTTRKRPTSAEVLNDYNQWSIDTMTKENKSMREVESLQKLNSVFVIKYYDSWTEGKHLYIQMDYCSITLRTVLKQKKQVFVRQSSEPMIIYEYFILCEIFRELLQCIEYLHGLDPPVIHRDIKPENILVSYNETTNTFLKLGDFGLAVEHERQSQSHTRGAGTPQYMAPVDHLNTRYDIKTDIYSVGGLVHDMFEIEEFDKHKYISTTFSAQFNRLEDIIGSMTDYSADKRSTSAELFHVFNDINGYNVLFVTNDDMVYGMGSNYYGSLGLGHNRAVNTPHIIPELCQQNIQQFICGMDFVLSINDNNCIHGWGSNDREQLARSLTKDYLKPNIISLPNNPVIRDISCGFYHSLVVTGDDCVYGWGFNRYGQMGCGEQHSKSIEHNKYDNNIINEMNKLSNICTKNVVQYISTWFEDNRYYIRMELCSHSLRTVLSLKGPAFGRRSAEEAMNSSEFFISCQIFAELLKCVQHLHDLSPAVIHRNLKPENVLIGGKAGNFHVFKSLSDNRNPEYLSPEETDGQTVDYKTDVYSAAKIAQNIFDIQLTPKL